MRDSVLRLLDLSFKGIHSVSLSINTQGARALGLFVLGSVVFGISTTQWPLYSSNQLTYLLHGLARGGFGHLQGDWMANTADPTPVFSMLVSFTYQYLDESFFYIYYILLSGVYVFSLAGVVSKVVDITSSRPRLLTYLTVLMALHSYVFYRLSTLLFGMNVFSIFRDGVAGQFVMTPTFEPSSFGVFLLLSIWIYLCGRPFLAIPCLAVAATFHPTYLFGAATLSVTYMLLRFGETKGVREPLRLGAFALLLVFPISLYVYQTFLTASPEVLGQARQILIEDRLPHHLNVETWLWTWDTGIRVCIILAGLCAVRKSKLFHILLVPFVSAVVLTLLQVQLDNGSLAVMLPWRVSVFLVPLSFALLIGWGVAQLFGKIERREGPSLIQGFEKGAMIAVLICFMGGGVKSAYAMLHGHRFEADYRQLLDFVQEKKSQGDKILIPPELSFESFRLATGMPIFVDWKTHPYKADEVVAWYDRMHQARGFYAQGRVLSCERLGRFVQDYGITHVLVESKRNSLTCDRWGPWYQGGRYAIYHNGAL